MQILAPIIMPLLLAVSLLVGLTLSVVLVILLLTEIGRAGHSRYNRRAQLAEHHHGTQHRPHDPGWP